MIAPRFVELSVSLNSLAMRRNAKRARMQEQALHKSVAQLFAAILTPATFATTFPAGGGGRVRGAILKSMGLRAGVPDWLLVHDGRAYFIELKGPEGTVSKDQTACHLDLEDAGSKVYVCRSLNDVVAALERWGIPTRVAKPPAPFMKANW